MLITFIIAFAVILADQISKYFAISFLKGGDSVYIIKGVLRLNYVENRGAAFGMLASHRWVFIVLSVIMIAAIVWYTCKFPSKNFFLRTGLALVLGGGVGNMIDRIFRGYVVDLIDFCAFPNLWKWVFNLADAAICIGVALIAVYEITDLIRTQKSAKAEKSQAGGGSTDE